MKKNELKNEYVKRYNYLLENAEYIMNLLNECYSSVRRNKTALSNFTTYVSNQYKNRDYYELISILSALESFLLGDDNSQYSELYLWLESKKSINKSYNESINDESLFVLLNTIRKFILCQYFNIENKNSKLTALNEYYKLNVFKNDGVIRGLPNFDKTNELSSIVDYTDVKYLSNTNFVDYLNNTEKYMDNNSILTEIEKEDVYLMHHDVIPYSLEIECSDNTCGVYFNIIESEISFVDGVFYQRCPYCHNDVVIPCEVLSEKVKSRIIERSSERKLQLKREC